MAQTSLEGKRMETKRKEEKLRLKKEKKTWNGEHRIGKLRRGRREEAHQHSRASVTVTNTLSWEAQR